MRAGIYQYLQAFYRYERATAPSTPAPAAALRSLVRSIEATCPGVLAGAKHAPNHNELLEIEAEELQLALMLSLGAAAVRAAPASASDFARAVASVHWTNPEYAIAFRAAAKVLTVGSAVHRPEICGEARTWAASGYKTLPHATVGPSDAIERAAPSPANIRVYSQALGSIAGSPLPRTVREARELLGASELQLAQTSGRVMRGIGLPPALITDAPALAATAMRLTRVDLSLLALEAPLCTDLGPLGPDRNFGVCRQHP